MQILPVSKMSYRRNVRRRFVEYFERKKLCFFFIDFSIFTGVRMGRIPKLVKEKALAEYISSSIENEDPIQSSSSRVPPINSNINNHLSTTNLADLHLPLIDDHSLFADLDGMPIDTQLNCHTPPTLTATMLSSCHSYQLPDNFTIDETKQEDTKDDPRIVKLNPSALSNYMTNCEASFANNVTVRMKNIVKKISHPTKCTELDYEESSFIRHLRWKLFELSNTYNGRTRQFIELMNSMIQLGVNC
jgi:hypothetical protein